MSKDKDPFYLLEQKEKETRDLLFSVLTENARLIEDNKRLRKEAEKPNEEMTMLGRPVVNVRTGKRIKREDLEGKVWYMDLKNAKKRRKK